VTPLPRPGTPPLRELQVRVSPPSARIMLDGANVFGNPFLGRYPRGETHRITASADGYQSKEEIVSLANNLVVDISLDKRRRKQPPPPGPKVTTAARETGAAHPPTPTPRPIPAAPQPAVAPMPATVDPAGGHAPVRPIQTRSPYDNNP
jgi:hypothetical protein